jgi:hypothetical protein
MEGSISTGSDPSGFIAAAYCLGILAVVGYALWLVIQRKRLRQIYAVVRPSQDKTMGGSL